MKKWDDYGASSLTLLAVYSGLDKADPDAPYDPSDFARCMHLFDCLNLSAGKRLDLLKRTAQKYPVWKPFYNNWGTLMILWRLERRRKSAPKLYAYIKKIRGRD